MIREENAFGKTYKVLTDKGKYLIQVWYGNKMLNELTVPKADIEYIKKCTPSEVHFYYSDRMIQEFEKHIQERKNAY